MSYAMKRLLVFAIACFLFFPAGQAQPKRKKLSDGAIAAAKLAADNKEVRWLSIDDVQVEMKKQPKKVWIDVYTDWCGWCKRMDATTFSHPEVIRYMNEHFYAVKLNAEQRQDIRFTGKMYNTNPTERTHPFAVQLLDSALSYPTSVFMEENFQTKQLIPGYLDVKKMEMILKYLGEGHYKRTPFDQFQAAFKPSWAVE